MSAPILYFAPGSGLGHLTRALAVSLELRELGVEAEIATNSPFAQPLARLARVAVTHIANDRWAEAAPRLLAERAPGAAVLDTFPNGLRGEWSQRPGVPLIHMARRLRLENYGQFAADGAAWRGFVLTLAIEPLAPEHQALLQPPVQALGGLIRLAPEWIGGAPPERLVALLDEGAALVVHGGPRGEVEQLVAHARAGSSGEVAAITPWQLDGVACFDYFPPRTCCRGHATSSRGRDTTASPTRWSCAHGTRRWRFRGASTIRRRGWRGWAQRMPTRRVKRPKRSCWRPGSVCHRINDVVDAEAVGESGHFGRVFGQVGVLPGIADVHLEIDGHDEAAAVIDQRAPMGRTGGDLGEGAAAATDAQVAQAGDLRLLVDIEEDVHERVVHFQFEDGLVTKGALHGFAKDLPFLWPIEIVDDEEAAAQQVFAQAGGFGVAQIPVAGLGGVDPGVVEKAVVGEWKMAGLADVEAGEAADAEGEVVVGFGPVLHPPAAAKTAAGAVKIVVFGADEVEFSERCGGPVVARQLGAGYP